MPRANPLPPDERRAAIIAATLPLLAEHGREVSTRQIAEAAAVAEGTIFRVFDNKDALIDAAVAEAFQPASSIAALDGIPRGAPLEARLGLAVAILQERLTTVFGLFHALRLQPEKQTPEQHEESNQREQALAAALTRVLEPDADRLAHSPARIAMLLRGVTFALTHPFITELPHDDPRMIVDLLLHGVLRTDASELTGDDLVDALLDRTVPRGAAAAPHHRENRC